MDQIVSDFIDMCWMLIEELVEYSLIAAVFMASIAFLVISFCVKHLWRFARRYFLKAFYGFDTELKKRKSSGKWPYCKKPQDMRRIYSVN